MAKSNRLPVVKDIYLFLFLFLAFFGEATSSSNYWLANVPRNGQVAFGANPTYPIFRNVQAFGAKGMISCSPNIQR